MPIYFYSSRDAYGCFSNFSPHGVELKGAWWPTTEHYFQAQKFAGTPHEGAARLAKTPKQESGSLVKSFLVPFLASASANPARPAHTKLFHTMRLGRRSGPYHWVWTARAGCWFAI
jgi:ribA/ribD-fused uncharacterized protein